ncbi:cellulose synthase [Neoaquamicrobium sediminum]|uniref:cellulose synthase n=1 Tax=Neoaquamicrobium sediminum TaxID=1849104 RepID=UPI003BAA7E22
MPIAARVLGRACLAGFIAAVVGGAAIAHAQHHWPINDDHISGETTDTVAAPFPVQDVPTAAEQMPPALVQAQASGAAPAPDAPQKVDESALRYFARQGDTKRLEIEIARLRALYPQWTPPADPLAVPVNVDEKLEAMWQLYSEGRLAAAREAIADRRSEEPDWQPPQDLLDRLALAEARERLVNASEIDQYATVIRMGSENPQLLTCGEVDVLWRIAEAFAQTDRQTRARDAYRYILDNCDNQQERLATIQNASRQLTPPLLDELLALERTADGGVGEFEPVRDDLARDAVARGGDDATATVPAERLARVEQLARQGNAASDARLLGWYYLVRDNHAEAETWFRMAREREDSAEASQGLALALMARGQHEEAETITFRWRDESDEIRAVYLAAAANLLGTDPRPTLSEDVLGRIVAEVVAARDVPGARQLGWYARAWEQHQTAGQWFSTALRWDPDDEPSAYGLALTRHLLGGTAGLAELKRIWAGRSDRIRDVGDGRVEPAPIAPALPRAPTATPQRSEGESQPSAAAAAPAAPQAAAQPRASEPSRRSCTSHVDPRQLSAEAALQRGWCLMDANRPMEAVDAFAVALGGSSEKTRRDAAWGQSLAYLRVELVDEAAVAATAQPQDARRANELQRSILAQRAAGAFERGRYVETLLALDERARIAPERLDLMVLRGYAYLNLRRINDAQRVFQALAATGSREGVKGLAEVRDALEPAR